MTKELDPGFAIYNRHGYPVIISPKIGGLVLCDPSPEMHKKLSAKDFVDMLFEDARIARAYDEGKDLPEGAMVLPSPDELGESIAGY